MCEWTMATVWCPIVGTAVPKSKSSWIPLLTHFLTFLFQLHATQRAVNYSEIEGKNRMRITLLYNQGWWANQWFFLCMWGRKPMENYLSGPPTTKSPLNVIFISWVRCGDAEKAQREFKTWLPQPPLQRYPFTQSQCGVFQLSKHLQNV